MAAFVRYRPISLSLKRGAGVVRDLLDSRVKLDGDGRLDADDRRDYDELSLFHDVFLAGDSLWMIGPPPLNLARALGPVEVRFGEAGAGAWRAARPRRTDHPRASVWRVAVPASLRRRGALEVVVRFARGPSLKTVVRDLDLPPVELQFATLQKDNEPEWIVDWLRHARRLGAARALVYDNASGDAAGLACMLAERVREDPAMPDVVFVDWPWPFGTRRNHANKFTKATHANHVHRRLGQARWTGHFDIDEYPVAGSSDGGAGAVTRLLDAQPFGVGAVRIDSWWVPRTGAAPEAGAGPGRARPWTARDFPLREPEPRGTARKLFVRTRAVRDVRTHGVRLRPGWWRRTLAPERLAFLHYKALTTGWKAHDERLGPVAPGAAALVEDRRLIESLAAIDAAG